MGEWIDGRFPAFEANLARIAKVLALLFFLLPWVTISCAEQTLVTMSGYRARDRATSRWSIR